MPLPLRAYARASRRTFSTFSSLAIPALSADMIPPLTRRQYYAAAAMVESKQRSIGARTAFCRVRPGLRTGSQPDATSRGTNRETKFTVGSPPIGEQCHRATPRLAKARGWAAQNTSWWMAQVDGSPLSASRVRCTLTSVLLVPLGQMGHHPLLS